MLRRTRALLVVLIPVLAVVLVPTTVSATVVGIRTDTHTVSKAVTRTADLRLPEAASRVATYWRGQPDAKVTVAFSLDGRTFSAPVDAGRDEVGEQRGNGITYGAVRVAAARFVRVATDVPLAQVWVDGMADGARTVTRVRGGAHAAVAQPAVSARSAWGADESLRFNADGTLKQAPTYFAVKKLIVHHTDTSNADPDPATTIRAIYRYHVVTQGWADIGYNFLVDESGRSWEGRWSRDYAGASPSGDDAAGRGVAGSHTAGWNSGTVGIALLGSLVDRAPTPAARSGLVELLAWEAERNGLDPKATTAFTNPVSGATKTTPNIAGHRDYVATECPGGVFYADLAQLRTDVATRIGGPMPPAVDSAAPTVPSNARATPRPRAVELTWTGSTDSTGVTGYLVQRSTSGKPGSYAQVATTTATTWTDTGLRSGRTYWYVVRARDAAGKTSASSAVASAKAL